MTTIIKKQGFEGPVYHSQDPLLDEILSAFSDFVVVSTISDDYRDELETALEDYEHEDGGVIEILELVEAFIPYNFISIGTLVKGTGDITTMFQGHVFYEFLPGSDLYDRNLHRKTLKPNKQHFTLNPQVSCNSRTYIFGESLHELNNHLQNKLVSLGYSQIKD